MNAQNDNPFILVAAALPPPLHGQSFVTACFLDALKRQEARLCIIDLSPRSLNRSPIYHLRKSIAVLEAAWEIIRFSFRHDIPAFYTVLDSGYGIFYNFLLCGLARLSGYRILIHHHTAAHARKKRPAFSLLLKILGTRAGHVALCERMADDLKRLYPYIGPILISENACYISASGEKRTQDCSAVLRLGMIGNLTVSKGAIVALETAIKAQQSGVAISLTLAGPVLEEPVCNAIEHARSILGESLRTPGPLYNQEKELFFLNTDILLFPSTYAYEAQSLVLLEALSCGCSIIATDQGYARDILGTNSHIVPIKADFSSEAVKHLKSLSQNILQNQEAENRAHFRFLQDKANKHLADVLNYLTTGR